MNDFLFLILGIIFAGIGGELFVRATAGFAGWARISPGIIGATFAAFATSSPELSVSVNAALVGKSAIGLGDALGSNVVNVALILGIALTISGIQSPRESIRRDFPVALLIPVFTSILCLDGSLSRLDGFLMLGVFTAWLVAVIMDAHKQRSVEDKVSDQAVISGKNRKWHIPLIGMAGISLLVTAGKLIVSGAKGIAMDYGLEEFIIGGTIVAVGTSIPELATVAFAKLRGHDEIGLGTILGSNIFNGVFIVSIAVIINPINIVWRDVAVTLWIGFSALVLAYPSRKGLIQRRQGILLLVVYVIYLAIIFQGKTK